MRIAFITGDAPWPSTAGGRLRDVATFEAASAVGEVHLVCFPFAHRPDMAAMPPGTRVFPMPWPTSPVRRFVTRVRATAHRRHVFQEHLIRNGALSRLSAALQAIDPDVTILGYPLFGDFVEVARTASPRLIVDLLELRAPDVDARIRTQPGAAERLRARLDRLVLGHVEEGVARLADEVWFVTELDAARYRTRTGGATRVVPNTVDVSRYARYREVQAEPRSMAFVGALDNAPNVQAARRLATRILPRLRARRSGVSLTVAGRRPPNDLVRDLADAPGATLVADAPDALEVVARHGPLVAPLESGSGTKLKIIEAAAAGVPVVTTPHGVAGLDFETGREVLVASTDAEFVAAVERLWDEPTLAEGLRETALATVSSRYDRHVAMEAIEAALREPGPTEARPPRPSVAAGATREPSSGRSP